MAENPELSQSILESGTIDTAMAPDSEITEKVSSYVPQRSLDGDNLRKLAADSFEPFRGGKMETLTYTDPHTGERKYTSRELAEQAQSYEDVNTLGKILGVAALSLGTYKGVGHLLGKGAKSLAILPTSVVAGTGASLSRPGSIRTDQGDEIPASTPFNVRLGNDQKLLTSLAADYARNCPSSKESGNLSYYVYKTAERKVDPLSGVVLDFDSAVGALGKVLIGA